MAVNDDAIDVRFLGRLADFGIGNPEGYRSSLADADKSALRTYAARLRASVRPVEDDAHDGCIDGRRTLDNADGSPATVRERHVSGSASNTEIALNADAVTTATDLGATITAVDALVEAGSGKRRSAHRGGCGGADGAIAHNRFIAESLTALEVTEALLAQPELRSVLETTYDAELGRAVRRNAASTADWLEENGWQGQIYVDRAAQEEPGGVENLRTSDDPHRGHAEDALVFECVEGHSVTAEDVFVVSVPAIAKKARALTGSRGEEGYRQAVIADLAKHVAVADALPHPSTPVFILA